MPHQGLHANACTGDARLDRLIGALLAPGRFPHPAPSIEVLQTHVSCVLLAGDYAYKIKKPVALGFLDFRALDARRHYCEEELRLNRRTAPRLYLEVIPIHGSLESPQLGGDGVPIEYALRMRRFAQRDLFDAMAREGRLLPARIDELARTLARFHAQAAVAAPGQTATSAAQALAPALQNFAQLLPLASAAADVAALARLRDWTQREHARLESIFDLRGRDGWVRECHGDLHLGNIALVDGAATPFDCIEFDASLRWIDVINELAFLVMDLLDHGHARLGYRLLNAYLEITGDYAGLSVLRYYLVYRALVRAKIAALRGAQLVPRTAAGGDTAKDARHHLRLAERLAERPQPTLILMHGVSGAGKSRAAAQLLETLGAVRLRSDVERKRLHGIRPTARAASAVDSGIYDADSNVRTYRRLAELARAVLDSGFPAIVDAAFLRRGDRAHFIELARAHGARYLIVDCVCDAQVLRARLEARSRANNRVSDAGTEVLAHQFATAEPLAADEAAHSLALDTTRGIAAAEVAAVAARLGLAHV